MKVRIVTDQRLDSPANRLELDGKNIADALTDATLRMSAGEFPRLELHLAILETVDYSGDVHVEIPESTREVLIDLGWTPPKEEQ